MSTEDKLINLEAQVNDLLAEKAELMKQLGNADPEIGQSYYLLKGHATIEDFYTEDNIKKVRMLIQPFSANDGVTLKGEPLKCSMPIETFKHQVKEYRLLKRTIDKLTEKRY